jgi:hypothetical protein
VFDQPGERVTQQLLSGRISARHTQRPYARLDRQRRSFSSLRSASLPARDSDTLSTRIGTATCT